MELEFFQGWFLFFFRRKIKVESVLKKIGKVLKKNEHGILKTDFSSRSMGEIFTQGNRDFYCFPKFLTSGHFSVGQKSLYFESILVPKPMPSQLKMIWGRSLGLKGNPVRYRSCPRNCKSVPIIIGKKLLHHLAIVPIPIAIGKG